MPSAATSEKTPSPMSGLMPTRLAPAAPAKAPFGMAWAGKAEPRRTTKKPTTPAMIATMVADLPRVGHEPREHQIRRIDRGRARVAGPDRTRARGSPARRPRDRKRGRDEHEATMKKLTGRPCSTGPSRRCRRPRGCRARWWRSPRAQATTIAVTQAPGHAQCGRGRTDQQGRREDRADGDGRQADRDGEGEHEEQADGAQADAPGGGELGADRADSSSGRWITPTTSEGRDAEDDDDGNRGRVDGEDRPEEDLLGRSGRRALRGVQIEEQRGQTGGGAQDDAGGQVSAPHPLRHR